VGVGGALGVGVGGVVGEGVGLSPGLTLATGDGEDVDEDVADGDGLALGEPLAAGGPDESTTAVARTRTASSAPRPAARFRYASCVTPRP
jgi:hypothetical protein